MDLAAHGYLEEEFFLDGEAMAYELAPGAALREDGRWDIVEGVRAEYATRLLVRRPVDPDRCNGTVYVEWLNVSGGVDIDAAWMHNCEELLRSGYVWVGVSAQRAGVLGPPVIPGLSRPLTEWDAERYGTRSIPDDAFSYDIFTQAARAVGPGRDTTVGRSARRARGGEAARRGPVAVGGAARDVRQRRAPVGSESSTASSSPRAARGSRRSARA